MKRVIVLLQFSFLVCSVSADPIHDAAKDNNISGIQAELDKGVDVDRKDPSGSSPFLYACAWGHEKAVLFLIEKGANINAKDNLGTQPFHVAASNSSGFKIVKLLIEKGLDVNVKNDDDVTPLHLAANKEIAELLIDKGADLNAKTKTSAETPLHRACSGRSKIELVEFLITRGADLNAKRNVAINSKDRLGATPLDYLLYKRRYEEVDLLRKYGGRTGPEDIAYQFESINNTITLLQHLIVSDSDGATPDKPSIEKLQGVFVIRGKVGGKYEVQYHTGDNDWQEREIVTLQSNRQLYIDSSSFDEKRFYRIKKVD